MSEVGKLGVPPQLWRDAREARHRLLMLDYDGTLAPFHRDRSKALPLPGTVECLRTIAASNATTVAVVSGRPIVDLEKLLGPLPITWIGEHGWEFKIPGGDIVHEPVPGAARDALDRAAAASAAGGFRDRLERKRTALVLHTRRLELSDAVRLESQCGTLWEFGESAGLLCRRIDGGLELRVQGHDKGTAVQRLLSASQPRALPVYLGDDDTDEDAFGAVQPAGYGIRVGPTMRPSRACARLASWEEVPEFLDHWLQLVERMSESR